MLLNKLKLHRLLFKVAVIDIFVIPMDQKTKTELYREFQLIVYLSRPQLHCLVHPQEEVETKNREYWTPDER